MEAGGSAKEQHSLLCLSVPDPLISSAAVLFDRPPRKMLSRVVVKHIWAVPNRAVRKGPLLWVLKLL
jgi:hypothetical protein